MIYLKKAAALALAFVFLLIFGSCSGREPGEAEDGKEIYGQWSTEEGVMYTLLESGDFYWHRNKSTLHNDYYWGPMEVYKGEQAMELLGITNDEWEEQYKSAVKSKEQVFCVRLFPNYMVHNGEVLEDPLGQPQKNAVQLRIMVAGDAASYYNYRTEVSGRLTREAEWIALPEAPKESVTLEAPEEKQDPARENIPQIEIEENGDISLTGTLAYNAQWYDSAGKAWKNCYVLAVSQETASRLAEALGAGQEKNLQEIQLFAQNGDLESYVGKRLTVEGAAQVASTTEHKRPMVFYAQEIHLEE